MLNASCVVTNECICSDYDWETGNSVPSDYCFGNCYDDQLFDFTDNFFGEWLKDNSESDFGYLVVYSDNMNWNKVSGYVVIQSNAKAVIEALMLNTASGCALEFEVKNNRLTCVRRSHDELGALFNMRLLTEAEVEALPAYN